MSRIKKIATTAACLAFAVAITLMFILIRNSIADNPNDTEYDPGKAESNTEPETEVIEKYIIEDNVLISYNGNDETVYIPDGIVEIGDWAFYQNKAIKTVIFPESVKIIKGNAFRGCESLANVELNEGLVEIQLFAFALCKELKTIDLPETLTTLGGDIFVGTGIEYLKVPGSVKEVPGLMSSSMDCEIECDTSLVTLEISSGTEKVSGFDDCLALQKVILPDTVTSVSGFEYCTALTDITLHEGITNIYGFRGCEQLADIEIPGTVTEFNAFQETSFWEGDEKFLIIGDGLLIRIKTDETSVTLPKEVKYISYLVEGKTTAANSDENYIYSPNLKEIILSAPAQLLEKGQFFRRSNDIKFVLGY